LVAVNHRLPADGAAGRTAGHPHRDHQCATQVPNGAVRPAQGRIGGLSRPTVAGSAFIARPTATAAQSCRIVACRTAGFAAADQRCTA